MIQKSHLLYGMAGLCVTGIVFGGIAVILERPFSTGVYAGEIPISQTDSGMQALQKHLNTLEESQFTLTHKDTQKEVSLADLGITIHRDQTLDKARKITSQTSWTNPLSIFQEQHIDIAYTARTNTLRKTLTQTFHSHLQETQNARFVWENDQLTVTSSQSGTTFDLEAFQSQLKRTINGADTDTELPVTFRSVSPQITETNLRAVHSRVSSFVTNDHIFAYADSSWRISPQKKLEWLSITEQTNEPHIMFRKDAIRSYLRETIASDLNRQAHNADIYFNPDTQDLTITEEGWEGRQIHTELSLKQFLEDLKAGETQTDLVVNRPKPDVYQKNLHTLNISTKLGSGTTTFTGSSASRVNNIRTSAQEMDGQLVMPGEEFSFVEHLGPITARTGYEPEMVIKNGQNVPEYGGGICQVSTTMFRAVMHTSLDITARQNHSYIIPMYGKPGFDATIYKPRPDFAFKNTTDSPILIQSQIDGTQLTFSIYGAPNTKRAEVEGPYTLNRTADGNTKTVVHRNIYNTETGQRIDRNSFYSYYEPRSNFETVQSYE